MSHSSSIFSLLQQQFTHARRQEKRIDITADLVSIVSIVANRSSNPVFLLRTIGIVFLGRRMAAFDFFALQSKIICTRARALAALRRDGWAEADSSDVSIGAIVGENKAKNWTVMEMPRDSPLVRIIEKNPALLASEANFGWDPQTDAALIGPGMPLAGAEVEPHYPLVPLQYECTDVRFRFDVPPRAARLSICRCDTVDIPYNCGAADSVG